VSNKKRNVKKVFLVHGDYDAQLAYKEYLETVGFSKVDIPEKGDWIQGYKKKRLFNCD
jgi:hypothetical protein